MLSLARPVSRFLILNCLAGTGLAGIASQTLAQEATPGQAAALQDSAAAQPIDGRRARLIRRSDIRHASLRRPKGPPGRIIRNINPQVEPAVTQPGPVRPVPVGPLAPIGAAAEAAGINLHLLFIDAYYNNFDMGVIKGISANTGLVITGADFDMGRIAGITGGTFHVLETIQTLRTHINNFAPAYGDLTAGFEPVFPATASQLSVLSYEQKLLDGAMTVEVGRSNPNRAFNLPIQGNFVSNWNNVWYQSAGAKVPTLASWMARVSYNITPAWYVQAGAYEDNPRAVFQYGFDWDARTSTGALALAEVGYKTDFTTTLYPSRFELLGFYNSSQRTDPAFSARGRSIVFNPTDPARTQDGSAGFIFNAQRVVWRADGGTEAGNLHPTSLVLFGSVSAAPYGIVPVTAEAYGGFTLQSPLQSRPYDSIGMKFHWTQLSNSEQSFLEMSNLIAGGTGYFKSRNSLAYELNAHIQLAQYVAIEPTIQYFQNANNFYNPRSARVARDGFFFGGTLQVALGQLLGLSSAP